MDELNRYCMYNNVFLEMTVHAFAYKFSSMSLEFLHPYFLGANAENHDLLESLLLEFVRDHSYWRRNFHPEDTPPIPSQARYQPEYLTFVARTQQELRKLSADLKRAVPFFSPRYVGHMSSDLLLPGVVAKLITTLYNPNNVSEEAAPVTLDKELQAGLQLARMFGFSCDSNQSPCAWGHLTSGGTVANYEALWNLRAVKFYPLALATAAQSLGIDFVTQIRAKNLSAFSPWELVNLQIDEVVALRRQALGYIHAQIPTVEQSAVFEAIEHERLEYLGMAEFFARHRDIAPPMVMVSSAGHYSWEKGMKLLGFGSAQLAKIAVNEHMRMDSAHLQELLHKYLAAERPVLATVGILGTTEFGTFDPIDAIVKARNHWRQRGADFGIHVDAAWGGYLMSVFRRADGSLHSRDELRKDFHYFPSDLVYNSFTALSQVDSITVDPHKLGYVPYAAGAFVARNRDVVDFVAQKAAYVFDESSAAPSNTGDKLNNLGMYILEGSKAGSAAASVYVSQQVLPLHSEGFGRVLTETVRACEYFYDTARERAERLRDRVAICIPFAPDSNLVCLAINPRGNTSLARMNQFGRQLFASMKVDAHQPLQIKEFICSYTSVYKKNLPPEQAERLLQTLTGIAPETWLNAKDDNADGDDHVFMLRHTLMNPWLTFSDGAQNYIDRYWDYLEKLIA